MNEGEDENHPEDGEDTVCGMAPVQDGVDVGLVRQVGAAALDVGEVGHDVDQAEQLDVVEVETPPGPVGDEHVQNIDERDENVAGHIVHVNLPPIVEEAPVDDGAEGGGVAVDVGQGPQHPVRERQAVRLTAVG